MSQIINITSEALQATIRRLLPSQQGFGEDLQASNVIFPVIDLTPTAEGSALPTDLARAQGFASQTAFSAQNSTTTIANTAGFYRIFGASTVQTASSGTTNNVIRLGDGSTTKTIWLHQHSAVTDRVATALNFDFIVFLDSGDLVDCKSNDGNAVIGGSSRQVADLQGNIVNPAGFAFQ